MTPEEFTAKMQEFRTTLTDKATELEEDPKWASADERVEIIHELEELVVQIEFADRDAGGGGRGRRRRRGRAGLNHLPGCTLPSTATKLCSSAVRRETRMGTLAPALLNRP